MEIIPVIDISRGSVVHAYKGQRAFYQPVRSCLCSGTDPVDIVQAFLCIFPFKRIYIADLDAISGLQTNSNITGNLPLQFPDIRFWIDEGNAHKDKISAVQTPNRIQVAGSETGISPDILNGLKNSSSEPVLSLDFRDGHFIGNMALLLDPECWPENVIVMNLGRVGSGEGPDLELLDKITSMAINRKFYLAGGIRHKTDLQILRDKGIAGVLIATGLHNGEISGTDLRDICM